MVEIEQNQVKLDECQTYSKQYCAAVKVSTTALTSVGYCLLAVIMEKWKHEHLVHKKQILSSIILDLF